VLDELLKRIMSLGTTVILVIGLAVSLQSDVAYAYIDLGTGSFLLQMLLATVFASLFTIKIFWKRLTSRISQILVKSGLRKPKLD
jgi:uncharacterized membrane protein YciS (DUF1049 family)